MTQLVIANADETLLTYQAFIALAMSGPSSVGLQGYTGTSGTLRHKPKTDVRF